MNILHSSKTSQWFTPPEIVAIVESAIGPIQLDPASCALANRLIRAERYCDNSHVLGNGLAVRWPVPWFCNPPYSRSDGGPVAPWVDHAIKQPAPGIMLLNATTDRRWFWRLWEHASWICFLYRRVRFCEPIEQATRAGRINSEHVAEGIVRGPSPTHGSVLVGFNGCRTGSARAFGHIYSQPR